MNLNKSQLDERRKERILKDINKDSCECGCYEREANELLPKILLFIAVMIVLIASFFVCQPVHAEEYSDEQIVNAIFHAEGGLKTRHPYGILAKYKHTSPRQACFNTVKNKRKQWVAQGSRGSFIDYLGSKYCPVGAANDPGGLNHNWIKNVTYFLGRNA